MSDEKLPTTRLVRLARMAALGGRATRQKVAGMLGDADAEAKLAKTAADTLGSLRGLALKVGQMASYVDGAVPEEHRDTYEDAMRKLRSAAPTMSVDAARRVVAEELGRAPEEIFASWTDVPFAAASIGQVHRAVTHDGDDVAVKVQFEGVDRAIGADLQNASMFTTLLGPIGSKLGVKAQMKEVRARFLEELDYTHEARRQQRFASAFEGNTRVNVPRSFPELSAKRVLTSSFANGISFDEATAADTNERRAWATTLWQFVFEGILVHGIFNADPHPGNYLFADDGAVWFLDFGCTRELSGSHLELVRALHTAGVNAHFAGLDAAVDQMFRLPKTSPARPLAHAYIKRCFEPMWTRGPFKITRAFAASMVDGLRENAVAMFKGPRKDWRPMPPEWVFFNRLQFGFYSVLARLDVDVDYNALERDILAAVPTG